MEAWPPCSPTNVALRNEGHTCLANLIRQISAADQNRCCYSQLPWHPSLISFFNNSQNSNSIIINKKKLIFILFFFHFFSVLLDDLTSCLNKTSQSLPVLVCVLIFWTSRLPCLSMKIIMFYLQFPKNNWNIPHMTSVLMSSITYMKFHELSSACFYFHPSHIL